MSRRVTRRRFLGAASAAGATVGTTMASPRTKLALLGGAPIRKEAFPSWPKIGTEDERVWMEVLHSGQWFRGTSGRYAKQFEKRYAELMGSRRCLATANGTSALFASLNALQAGPGDEVLVPPYTFVATVNVVLLQHALPVFIDTDPETFQIDAGKIEAAITERTKAIIPVHLGGSVADLDSILTITKKHKLPVIEDACQAHLAEWRGRRVGSLGDLGCFSFQASKNLNSGEGGAILSDNEELIERCYAFHNNGRGRKTDSYNFSYRASGANLRMTQFQCA